MESWNLFPFFFPLLKLLSVKQLCYPLVKLFLISTHLDPLLISVNAFLPQNQRIICLNKDKAKHYKDLL